MEKRRRIDRLNHWLTLAANVGVIVGLFVLIVEVRQNANLTRAEMLSNRDDLLVQIEMSLASPEISAAWVKSIRDPESLSDTEIRMVESHLVAMMMQWHYMFTMEEAGLTSRGHTRQHILNVAPYYFGSRHGKNWWRWQEAGWDGTAMMEVAGPIVNAVDENFMLRYLEGTNLGASAHAIDDTALIEREAQTFMQEYAADLIQHSRSAIAARYHGAGATVIFNGERTVRSFDEIEARYLNQWQGPTHFEWHDLAYEMLGPDSVIVTGAFDWGTPDGLERYAYSSILQRQAGEFRIRLEVESRLPDPRQ